jgi:aminoglycoside phosphotransferase (APT) family kinase protein
MYCVRCSLDPDARKHYYAEIKPLLSSFSGFDYVNGIVGASPAFPRNTAKRFAESYTQKLATIHPFPPAQLPNFAKGLDGHLLPGASKRIAEEDTLAFMDAGAYCNIRSLAPTLRLLN